MKPDGSRKSPLKTQEERRHLPVDSGKRTGLVQPVPEGGRVLRTIPSKGSPGGKFGGFSFEPNYENAPAKKRAEGARQAKNYRKFQDSLATRRDENPPSEGRPADQGKRYSKKAIGRGN
jgi:hypothetical protein